MDVDWDRVPSRYERGPAGKIRPLWRGVLLTVVTLGLYHFWWHLRTHHELMVFTNRRNRLQYVGWAYVAVFALLVSFVLFMVIPAAIDYEGQHGRDPFSQHQDDPPTEVPGGDSGTGSSFERLRVLDFLRQEGLLGTFLLLIILEIVAFTTFVLFQHRALYQHIEPTHQWGKDASLFLCLYWGSSLISWVIPFAALLKLFSYYSLQDTYNRFWTEIQQERSPVPLPITDEPANPVDDAQGL